MRYLMILPVLVFYLACTSRSESFDGNKKFESVCDPVIKNFFQGIESGNYKSALSNLLSSNENIDLKDTNTVAMEERFAAINQYSGAYRGNSLLKKKSINNDLAIYSYLAKYDKKFYRFVFVFYNNGLRTKLYKFTFDDNAELEIEESLKLYM